MTDERFRQCRAQILSYADHLVNEIKGGRLNEAAFEGLVRSKLNAPSYDVTFRDRLLALAIKRLTGRQTGGTDA